MSTHKRGSFCVRFCVCEVEGISWQLYRRSCDRSSVVMGWPGTAPPSRSRIQDERDSRLKSTMWKRRVFSCIVSSLTQKMAALLLSEKPTLPESPWQHKLHSLPSEWERGREGRLMKWWNRRRYCIWALHELDSVSVLTDLTDWLCVDLFSYTLGTKSHHLDPFYSIVEREVNILISLSQFLHKLKRWRHQELNHSTLLSVLL